MSTLAAPAHSKLPPSSASRWSTCTASIGFIEQNKHLLPEQDWTLADEGSRAHEAARLILTGSKETPKFDNSAMQGHVEAYVSFCQKISEPDDRILTETRVPLFYLPTERGTVDRAHINSRRIFIADLKYGAGVSVEAKQNKQLAIYAESLIHQWEQVEQIDDSMLVTLAIFQPRDRNNPEPVRLWVINRRELREFTQTILDAAGIILSGGKTQFVAGPHCDKSFCPARGLCKAYGTEGLKALDDDAPVDAIIESKMIELPQPNLISREQRQRVVKAKPALIAWLEAVENQEVAELMSGADPIDFKLVEGKSNRQWVDESVAAKSLLDFLPHEEIYPPTPAEIVSPAQAEKKLKAAGAKVSLADLTMKPAGKPTLVPVTDKRQALSFNPTGGLADLGDNPQDLI